MTVDIVFDEDLDTTRSAPAASAFMVTVGTADPVAVAPASVAFHSTDADTFTLTMSTATAGRPQVSVDYTKPELNALADLAGNVGDDGFPQQGVYAPAAPDAPALTAGEAVLDVAWTAPTDDGGRPVTGYTVQWRTDVPDLGRRDRREPDSERDGKPLPDNRPHQPHPILGARRRRQRSRAAARRAPRRPPPRYRRLLSPASS